jgi:flagellar biosynthesis/type III secretory pathway protein FliH
LLEKEHQFPLTGDLEFHILELPKFTKTLAELSGDLDIWLYFLRHAAMIDTDAVPEALRKPLVLRALEELKMLTQSDLERERYEARRKAQLDHNAILMEAQLIVRENLEKGLQQGLEQGRQQGLEQGRQQGLEQGRQQGLEQGRQAGLQEGQAKGEKIGIIHMCERLLHRPETPTDKLVGLLLEELTRLGEELQKQIEKRVNPIDG